MKDTSEKMMDKFHEMMMEKSGEERFLMGCSMYDTAREIVISSIQEKNPQISSRELKGEIFLRFYGLEFNEADKKKIMKELMPKIKTDGILENKQRGKDA